MAEKAKRGRPPKASKPKQTRLPGMQDNAIMDLEEAAVEHSDLQSDIRESREEMKKVDEKIATIMRREGKTEYRRGGIHLKLKKGRDGVSVQVKKHDRKDD